LGVKKNAFGPRERTDGLGGHGKSYKKGNDLAGIRKESR